MNTQLAFPHAVTAIEQTRARHWFMTENNPEGSLDVEFEFLYDAGIIEYATWQLEVGDEGNEHHQAYVQFKKQTRFAQIKKLFPRAHLQLCIDPSAARAYCQKKESRLDGPFEVGIWIEPKDKSAVWKHIRDDIISGMSERQLWDKYPAQVMMYSRGITKGMQLVSAPRSKKTSVILIYGLPGVGKSRFIYENHPSAYWKQPDSNWFDGYDGTSDVVFDDYYGWLPLSSLLRLLDRYPLAVQTKGGSINFAPKKLLISSNTLPRDWYAKVFEKQPQYHRALVRRIDALVIANSSGPDNWTYYYGAQARSKLENPTIVQGEAGLDGTGLADWNDDYMGQGGI